MKKTKSLCLPYDRTPRLRRGVEVLIFLFLSMSFFSGGCLRLKKENPEEKKLAEVVYLYNDTLIEVYQKQNPELLTGIATEEQINQILKHLVVIAVKKEKMAYELKKLDFQEFKIGEDKASVKTEEDWRYRRIDMKTKKQKGKAKDLRYRVTYKLIKEKDKDKNKDNWLISSLDAKEL